MTIQASVPGLTSTASPLLATTTSAAPQTITSHIQQVPVRAQDRVAKYNQGISECEQNVEQIRSFFLNQR